MTRSKEVSPLQICTGSMAIGNVSGMVTVNIVEPNSKRKMPPSKVFMSDAPVAKAPATTTGIKGCGEWATHVMESEGIHYACIRIVKLYGKLRESAMMLLRIHESAPVQIIHAKIPNHHYSTMASGKVPVFTGRADILDYDTAVSLGLDSAISLKDLYMDADTIEAKFMSVTTLVDKAHKRVVSSMEVVKDDKGVTREVQVKRTRRAIRIRKD